MVAQNLSYFVDGRAFDGRLFYDPRHASPRPGVLVCHEGSGPSDHIWERAQMLADLGFVTYAPDLFGETFASRETGIGVITSLISRPQILRARMGGALWLLKNRPQVDVSKTAAIGFCFGGLAVLELARDGADVACVASFHGGLSSAAPAEPGRIKTQILVCTGAADPFIGPEDRAAFETEMTRAGADWRVITYSDTQHGFTNRHLDSSRHLGSAYHGRSDRRSWRAMLDMFEEVFGVAL